jgi:hypothetical protein
MRFVTGMKLLELNFHTQRSATCRARHDAVNLQEGGCDGALPVIGHGWGRDKLTL